MPVHPSPQWPQRLLERLPVGRSVAGRRPEDALGAAREVLADGRSVALEHRGPAGSVDGGAHAALVALVRSAGPPGDVELTLPVDRVPDAWAVAAEAADAGLGVALTGPAAEVAALAEDLPYARVVVPAGEPGAESRCRELADRRVRLRAAGGVPARRAFVRCLNVLMAADGDPAVEAGDPTLVAITGERAAWYGLPSDSWEHVMPWRVRTDEQRRLVAAGARVRATVAWGGTALPGGLR